MKLLRSELTSHIAYQMSRPGLESQKAQAEEMLAGNIAEHQEVRSEIEQRLGLPEYAIGTTHVIDEREGIVREMTDEDREELTARERALKARGLFYKAPPAPPAEPEANLPDSSHREPEA